MYYIYRLLSRFKQRFSRPKIVISTTYISTIANIPVMPPNLRKQVMAMYGIEEKDLK